MSRWLRSDSDGRTKKKVGGHIVPPPGFGLSITLFRFYRCSPICGISAALVSAYSLTGIQGTHGCNCAA